AEGDRYHIQLHEQQQNGNHSTPMKHTYSISGMTCNGCRSHVEKALSEIPGVINVEVDLEKAQAEIEMEKHISLKTFQEKLEQDGGTYSIGMPGEKPKPKAKPQATGSGVYYCPMHCEGEKTYDKPGDCPVCGMDLVEAPSSTKIPAQYTCPMHPEIVQDEPGSCP